MECWGLQKLPHITAIAFNHCWEQLLAQTAHGSDHPTQRHHIPPPLFCLLLGWECCFLGGPGMVKGWSDLLKEIRGAPTSVHAALPLHNLKAPLAMRLKQGGNSGQKSFHSAALRPTYGTPRAQGLPKKGWHQPISSPTYPSVTDSPRPYSLCVRSDRHTGKCPTSASPCREWKIITNSYHHSQSIFHPSA